MQNGKDDLVLMTTSIMRWLIQVFQLLRILNTRDETLLLILIFNYTCSFFFFDKSCKKVFSLFKRNKE